MRKLVVFAAALISVGLVAPSQASIHNGDKIRLTDGPGNGPGGAFNVQDLTAPYASDFRTFCIERNEYISIPGDYYATVEPNAIFGGIGVSDVYLNVANGVLNSYDPVSPLTAWLYSHALAGTLTGYSAASNSDNDALQDAIWYVENEIAALPVGLATTYFNAAKNAYIASPYGVGGVRALNLWATPADAAAHNPLGKKQTMLIMVPEATTIAVWSLLSLVGAGFAYRKRPQA